MREPPLLEHPPPFELAEAGDACWSSGVQRRLAEHTLVSRQRYLTRSKSTREHEQTVRGLGSEAGLARESQLAQCQVGLRELGHE